MGAGGRRGEREREQVQEQEQEQVQVQVQVQGREQPRAADCLPGARYRIRLRRNLTNRQSLR